MHPLFPALALQLVDAAQTIDESPDAANWLESPDAANWL
jgi:hypothetical protein